eukprot:COSAG06_NODE_576_length_14051_cov_5.354644_9_plen_182_part_00
MKRKTFVVAESPPPKRSLSRCSPLVGSSSSQHSKHSKYSKHSKHSKFRNQRCGGPSYRAGASLAWPLPTARSASQRGQMPQMSAETDLPICSGCAPRAPELRLGQAFQPQRSAVDSCSPRHRLSYSRLPLAQLTTENSVSRQPSQNRFVTACSRARRQPGAAAGRGSRRAPASHPPRRRRW